MSEKISEEHCDMAARQIAMSFLTATVANGYLESAVDELTKARLFKHEVKRRINYAIGYFDHYVGSIKWVFSAAGGGDVGRQLIEDYEVLQEACDRFMRADVRLTAREVWESDDLRQPDIYLCRVEGAGECSHMVLRWTERRQWLMYMASQYGGGWQGLLPGVRVMKVVERVSHADDDEKSK